MALVPPESVTTHTLSKLRCGDDPSWGLAAGTNTETLLPTLSYAWASWAASEAAQLCPEDTGPWGSRSLWLHFWDTWPVVAKMEQGLREGVGWAGAGQQEEPAALLPFGALRRPAKGGAGWASEPVIWANVRFALNRRPCSRHGVVSMPTGLQHGVGGHPQLLTSGRRQHRLQPQAWEPQDCRVCQGPPVYGAAVTTWLASSARLFLLWLCS